MAVGISRDATFQPHYKADLAGGVLPHASPRVIFHLSMRDPGHGFYGLALILNPHDTNGMAGAFFRHR